MGSSTDIQWVSRLLPDGHVVPGHTFNAWWGCMKVSEGCKHCYAEGIAARYGYRVWGPEQTTARRTFGTNHWTEPLKWNRQAQKQGHRHSVFCSSMADVFEHHPALENERPKLWDLIRSTPWLNWLLLTKRPENILALSPWGAGDLWPDNVWVGTSVELQHRAEERLPFLLQVPAQVRFLSCEPLLGPLDLTPWLRDVQWVISGGESGMRCRPMDLQWVRDIRDQCTEAMVPYFFKQVGGRYHSSGGRLLDGREWDEMPPEVPTGALIASQGRLCDARREMAQ